MTGKWGSRVSESKEAFGSFQVLQHSGFRVQGLGFRV